MADSNAALQVELVAADRTVWSRRASMVLARTTEGDVGILANHAPVLSVLVPGVVDIHADGEDHVVAAVDGGFLSVAGNRVSILAERTVLSHEVDVSSAQADLDAAEAADDDAAEVARKFNEALIRAAEWSS